MCSFHKTCTIQVPAGTVWNDACLLPEFYKNLYLCKLCVTTCHFTIIVLAMTGEKPLGWVLEFNSLAQYSAMLPVIPDTGHLVCPLRLGLPLSPTKIATLFKYPKMYESCFHISHFSLLLYLKQLHVPSRPKNCTEKHLPADPRVVRWLPPKRICNEVMSFLPFRRFPSARVDMLERYVVFSGRDKSYQIISI